MKSLAIPQKNKWFYRNINAIIIVNNIINKKIIQQLTFITVCEALY